jgi:hypothetical protein
MEVLIINSRFLLNNINRLSKNEYDIIIFEDDMNINYFNFQKLKADFRLVVKTGKLINKKRQRKLD